MSHYTLFDNHGRPLLLLNYENAQTVLSALNGCPTCAEAVRQNFEIYASDCQELAGEPFKKLTRRLMENGN